MKYSLMLGACLCVVCTPLFAQEDEPVFSKEKLLEHIKGRLDEEYKSMVMEKCCKLETQPMLRISFEEE